MTVVSVPATQPEPPASDATPANDASNEPASGFAQLLSGAQQTATPTPKTPNVKSEKPSADAVLEALVAALAGAITQATPKATATTTTPTTNTAPTNNAPAAPTPTPPVPVTTTTPAPVVTATPD